MTAFVLSAQHDPVAPRPRHVLTVTVEGEPHRVRAGSTVAALLLATGRTSWRTTRHGDRPRGVFCGIGVCFDCLVVVNGQPDIRACQRVLADGDDIRFQRGAMLPAGDSASEGEPT